MNSPSEKNSSVGSKPAPAQTNKSQRGVQSVEVSGRVLHALAQARGALTLSELATRAQLAPAQAHAYLVSLVGLGLVKRDTLGRYEPGPMALRLGLLHFAQQPALRAALPHAMALAENTGVSVALCVAGPQGPTIVRYLHTGFALHVNLHVGTVMSLPMTATGRVFCAFLPAATLNAMWTHQSGSTGRELATSAGRPAFEAALTAIRARGMERSVDNPTPGISSLCVPVLDANNRLCLTLTLIGATGVLEVQWTGGIAQALQRAASTIHQELMEAAARRPIA
ncbi:IclR family transcriptional regulator [Paraburkholderia hayleyella]|uniref:IclR family transcriptional regulator n=1 Tax=Paraburkholderia hayleyella TaxID=2152889 RepID=UPI001290EC0E|nr:IclR family transcriptional regulator [Paraburkholderia hayleyella]